MATLWPTVCSCTLMVTWQVYRPESAACSTVSLPATMPEICLTPNSIRFLRSYRRMCLINVKNYSKVK